MYCSKCGNEIQDDAKFCIYCGNKIILDFPFMIQDGTGLFFNEDYACYYGLGACNVIYNGGASNNFHFENISFTELEK